MEKKIQFGEINSNKEQERCCISKIKREIQIQRKFWIQKAKKKQKLYVFYENSVLDLTQFAVMHPGGFKSISNYKFKDIAPFFYLIYPHQKCAKQKLLKYKIGSIKNNSNIESLFPTKKNLTLRLPSKKSSIKPSSLSKDKINEQKNSSKRIKFQQTEQKNQKIHEKSKQRSRSIQKQNIKKKTNISINKNFGQRRKRLNAKIFRLAEDDDNNNDSNSNECQNIKRKNTSQRKVKTYVQYPSIIR